MSLGVLVLFGNVPLSGKLRAIRALDRRGDRRRRSHRGLGGGLSDCLRKMLRKPLTIQHEKVGSQFASLRHGRAMCRIMFRGQTSAPGSSAMSVQSRVRVLDRLHSSDDVSQALKERFSKAEGHINAAERKLWRETERGFWSGRQAIARISEAWLHLEGLLAELPALDRYLPAELTQVRIDTWVQHLRPGPVYDAWQEIRQAEAAIHAHPFSEGRNLFGPAIRPHVARLHRYVGGLRNLRDAVAAEIVGRCVRLRPIAHAALEAAILDALWSESLFDALPMDGDMPDSALAARGVADEISAKLEGLADREYLDLSIRRDMPYSQVHLFVGGPSLAEAMSDEFGVSQPTASLVIFDRAENRLLHVLEVFGRWERSPCLEALCRLARILHAGAGPGSGPGNLQSAGIAIYHTHHCGPEEMPSFDLDGGPTLGDDIKTLVESAFSEDAPVHDKRLIPTVETFSVDRWAFVPGVGDGSLTGALIQFKALPEGFVGRPR